MQLADIDPVAVVSQQGRAVEATKQPAANGLPWLRMLIATLGACALVGIGFGVGSDVDWEAPPSDGMVVTELNTYEKDGYVGSRQDIWRTVETPADIDAVTDTAWRQNYKHTGDVLAQVLAGVDTALWDLVARNLNVSVCTLVAEVMGGECKSHMPVYGSNGNRETDMGLLLANAVHNHDKYGVQAFKFQIAQRMGGDVDITPNRTETLIPLARQLLGPEVTLLADANGGYDTIERAKPIAQLLIDNNFTFFEEPYPFWEYDKAAALGAAMPGMPIALGEQEYRMDVWQRNVHAMDVWQPDVHYIGGVSRSLAVARMSMEAGARFVPHSPNPSFVAVFTLHIAAAVPNAFQFMEADAVNTRQPPDGKRFFTEGVLKIKDGKMKVPTGAGWGVALRSDWVDEASKRTSKMKSSPPPPSPTAT
ncbi:hypothetical protein EMIHUDRAFT_239592 [Emiliania huxleyi CCMP1516]|uniref:Mandelate racemase/muconate lactonizing enzyme C-terminal domain-containing protein n=2 Tax=Emiliania huxleyi TaxID=2903 RepID=A0A0D3JJ14_EMIH1|nr:hypothetical protein EMIHUDRAFT_239592 [Emiliania huxleyi CCMP1516]EOD23499.1 hypothetical protein EMIHUDRAFT_239592 [Emiliania huxleyi CCMP1516]|eukprot:XP_005775928.1 hypothetical protein EMIHUDRAFT_239592 [Emiliania huxleyi CCMP1516]